MATGTTTIAPGYEITDRISPSILNNLVTHLIISISGVTAADLNADAVTTEKIKNKAVTTPKLADGAITEAKLTSGAVTVEKLAEGAVTAEKIAAGAVTADAIAEGAITVEKLAGGVAGAMLGEVRYLALELGADEKSWVYADGSEYNTTDYPELLDVIVSGRWRHGYRIVGSVYYFKVPKLNHFVRGWYPGMEADYSGGAMRTLGGVQTEAVGEHTHKMTVAPGRTATANSGSNLRHVTESSQLGMLGTQSYGDNSGPSCIVIDRAKATPASTVSVDIAMNTAGTGDLHPANTSLAVIIYLGKKATAS